MISQQKDQAMVSSLRGTLQVTQICLEEWTPKELSTLYIRTTWSQLGLYGPKPGYARRYQKKTHQVASDEHESSRLPH